LPLSGGMPPALARAPGATVPLTSESRLVAGGAGNQTDPHVSGSLVTWSDISGTESRIGYADLAAGTTGLVPNAGHRDSLSDVAGDLVFRRVPPHNLGDGDGAQAAETLAPPSPIAPRRRRPAPTRWR
jgi:hypothetical protein